MNVEQIWTDKQYLEGDEFKHMTFDVDFLEDLLCEWMRRMLYFTNFRLSNSNIQSKALEFKLFLHMHSFFPNQKWVDRFRSTFHLRKPSLSIGYKEYKSVHIRDLFHDILHQRRSQQTSKVIVVVIESSKSKRKSRKAKTESKRKSKTKTKIEIDDKPIKNSEVVDFEYEIPRAVCTAHGSTTIQKTLYQSELKLKLHGNDIEDYIPTSVCTVPELIKQQELMMTDSNVKYGTDVKNDSKRKSLAQPTVKTRKRKATLCQKEALEKIEKVRECTAVLPNSVSTSVYVRDIVHDLPPQRRSQQTPKAAQIAIEPTESITIDDDDRPKPIETNIKIKDKSNQNNEIVDLEDEIPRALCTAHGSTKIQKTLYQSKLKLKPPVIKFEDYLPTSVCTVSREPVLNKQQEQTILSMMADSNVNYETDVENDSKFKTKATLCQKIEKVLECTAVLPNSVPTSVHVRDIFHGLPPQRRSQQIPKAAQVAIEPNESITIDNDDRPKPIQTKIKIEDKPNHNNEIVVLEDEISRALDTAHGSTKIQKSELKLKPPVIKFEDYLPTSVCTISREPVLNKQQEQTILSMMADSNVKYETDVENDSKTERKAKLCQKEALEKIEKVLECTAALPNTGSTTSAENTKPTVTSKLKNKKPPETRNEALKYLKLLEEFAMMRENFRLIGYIERLERLIKEGS